MYLQDHTLEMYDARGTCGSSEHCCFPFLSLPIRKKCIVVHNVTMKATIALNSTPIDSLGEDPVYVLTAPSELEGRASWGIKCRIAWPIAISLGRNWSSVWLEARSMTHRGKKPYASPFYPLNYTCCGYLTSNAKGTTHSSQEKRKKNVTLPFPKYSLLFLRYCYVNLLRILWGYEWLFFIFL